MRDLVTHLLIGNRLFLDAVRGGRPASLEGSTDCAAVPDDELLGAYRAPGTVAGAAGAE